MSSLGAGGPGRRLGRYHLADPLGGGPTGEVFRAKVYGVAGFERQFAIKRFHADLVKDPDVAAQLATATRMYGSLEHPRIARLHEYGVAGGETFTAVELVEGVDLARLLSTSWGMGEPLQPGAVAGLVSQLSRAIGYAHGRGICHLGVCPTNLICTADGEVKVTDFGVLPPRLPARPANDTTLHARIPYLAPEQLVGEPTSCATDVFQIGSVAYQLFTGEPCFKGSSAFEIGQMILSARPPSPTLPKPLVKVLIRCLARSPFERFPDAGALADALDAAVRSTPLPGAKRDIATAVTRARERMASMNRDGASGALSFPLPAPPPKMPVPAMHGGGPSFGDRPSQELTAEVPTIPRKTMMGVGLQAKGFKIPDIPRVDAAGDGDEDPTRIRERKNQMLQPVAPPSSVPPPPGFTPAPEIVRQDQSVPAIELSMDDLEVPGDSVVAPAPQPPPGPPPQPPPGPPPSPVMQPPVQPPAQRLATIEDSAPAEALPEVSVLPLPPEPEAPPAPPVAGKKGRGLWIAAAVLGVAGLGVGGFFGYQAWQDGGAEEVAQAAKPSDQPVADDTPVVAESDDDDDIGEPAGDGDGDEVAVAAPVDAGVAAAAVDGAVAAAVVPVDDDDDDEHEAAPEEGKLRFESEPEGAKVYVDGTLKGKTPITVDGFADTVSVALIRPGFKLHTAEIDGTGLHKVTLEEVAPPDGPAGIKVRCKKKNRYYVSVDGHDVGQLCPTERIGVETGEHVVEIYDPETEQRRVFRIDVKQTRISFRVYVD